MKTSLLVLGICAGLASVAQAVPIVINLTAPPVGDIPRRGTGIGGSNSTSAENNFYRLETFLSTHPGDCTPIFDGAMRFEGYDAYEDVDVSGFSYGVIRYGRGRRGIRGSGGGIEFFSISGDGIFSFPEAGTGPNGNGYFCSLDLFKCAPNQVPDGGSTAMLLGTALSGIGLLRRYVKR